MLDDNERQNAYLPGSLIMAELAQEINVLHKLLLVEAQVENSARHSTLSEHAAGPCNKTVLA